MYFVYLWPLTTVQILSEISELSTNKTHDVITMLCVENLYLEVNMNVILTEGTSCRNKWWGDGDMTLKLHF